MTNPTRTSIDPQQGYDLWANTYDDTPNPVVSIDTRYTISHLDPQPGEKILDAGCGTGRNIQPLLDAEADVVGVDFSAGMIDVARAKHPKVTFVTSSLDALPDHLVDFDAILCALVGEHLRELEAVFRGFHRALKPTGRLTFSAYHPWMAAAGIEANFTLADKEYRLGAETHTVDDYTSAMAAQSFSNILTHTYDVDDALVAQVPKAAKYLGKPLLLVFTAQARP
jgi:ubiquinone/menaquinone biosynthesis C-methylase UbiE